MCVSVLSLTLPPAPRGNLQKARWPQAAEVGEWGRGGSGLLGLWAAGTCAALGPCLPLLEAPHELVAREPCVRGAVCVCVRVQAHAHAHPCRYTGCWNLPRAAWRPPLVNSAGFKGVRGRSWRKSSSFVLEVSGKIWC